MSKKRLITIYFCLFLAIIMSAVLCVFVGSIKIIPSDIFVPDTVSNSIVFNLRLPRMVAAVFAGGALSVSGYLLQTYFHNPIAGPYLLGISSGAKLMVAVALIVFAERLGRASNLFLVIFSFIGAMLAMGFVLLISEHVGSMSMLLVCGVMIGYICTAICDLLVAFADDSDIVNLHNWSKGSLSGINMTQAELMMSITALCVALAFLLSKPMSAYLVSENYAKSVGVNVKLFRVALIILSGVLSASVTAFAGPVSFVGIAVPHLIRKIMKSEKPVYITTACFLGGAVFTCICDLISRTIFAPTELSISTVTAVFGSPVVIYMLLNRNRRQE